MCGGLTYVFWKLAIDAELAWYASCTQQHNMRPCLHQNPQHLSCPTDAPRWWRLLDCEASYADGVYFTAEASYAEHIHRQLEADTATGWPMLLLCNAPLALVGNT